MQYKLYSANKSAPSSRLNKAGPFIRTTQAHLAQGLTLVAAVAGLVSSVGGYASAAPYNPSDPPPPQLAAVGRICQNVMRLQPGEEHFVGCVESLSSAVQGQNQRRQWARARDACLTQGLKDNTPGFAACVLQSGRSANLADDTSAIRISGADTPVSGKSYYAASPQDMRLREETACAELGIDPGTTAFDACIGNLGGALFAADHPMN
jgi:hypothetical protein